jgi:hypothetical protein
MTDGPKTDSERIAAICLLFPDDPQHAVDLATVACAAAVLTAGVDEDAAVDGLRTALESMRDNGFGQERH